RAASSSSSRPAPASPATRSSVPRSGAPTCCPRWTPRALPHRVTNPMAGPAEYSYVRYLHAKRTVDERALHRGVLDQLRGALASLPEVPRVLELGAGVGTMVSRLADAGWLARARYTLLDSDGTNLAAALEHLRSWGGPAAQTDGARL